MGHRTDWLALAGTSRVKSYFRKSKSGKMVQVDAHTRSIDKMSFDQLQAEFKRLQNSTAPADVNRRAAVVSRIREESDSNGNFDPAKAQKASLQRIKESAAANRERIIRERESSRKAEDADRSALFESMEDMPTGRARLKKARADRQAAERRAAEAEPGLQSFESRVNDRQAKREAARPAAVAAIKKAGSLQGLDDLSDSELQAVVDATNWNEPGDEWGERAQEILSSRVGEAVRKANEDARASMDARRGRTPGRSGLRSTGRWADR